MNSGIATFKELSPNSFYNDFVRQGQPVLLKGGIDRWDACKSWDFDYFKNKKCDKLLRVKRANIAEGKTDLTLLRDYVSMLEIFDKHPTTSNQPPYLHDVGLFSVIPDLTNDVLTESIKAYLPAFYHQNWWKYAQFFMSVRGHVTPLHFDTLVTHNLFFQVKGKKRFTLIPWNQKDGCYITKWRWSQIDPTKPDLKTFTKYSSVNPITVEVEGGDILFMPAGMLHHVESMSFSISFNIDWHSKRSVIRGLLTTFQGAPKKNIQYNFLMFLAIWCRVPERYIWPYYKSYLNYIS